MAMITAGGALSSGGAITRALSGSRSFNGGRANASIQSLDKKTATKILQGVMHGRIEIPKAPVLIMATDEVQCKFDGCEYIGKACQKLGGEGMYYCLNCRFGAPTHGPPARMHLLVASGIWLARLPDGHCWGRRARAPSYFRGLLRGVSLARPKVMSQGNGR